MNPIGDEKYRLVCGERRVRAIRLLNQSSIPAIITKMDEATAYLAQLAENVQRENLTLEEKARAVRKLFTTSGSVGAVALQVKRSKAWVSKHLEVTCPDFDWRARQMLEDGVTEDLELLNLMAKIGEVASWKEADQVEQAIRAGEMNREQAREWLRTKKLGIETERIANAIEKSTAERKPEEKKKIEKVETKAEAFTAGRATAMINHACFQEDASVGKIMAAYTAEQIGMIETEFLRQHEAGLQARASGNAVLALARAILDYNSSALDIIAALRGFMDCPLSIRGIVEDAIEAVKEDEA